MRLGLSWRSSAPAMASIVPDRAGRDLVALADQVGHLAHDGARHRDRVVVTVEREHVPAQEDLAVEVLLECLHHRVARSGELRGNLVRKLELDSHQWSPPKARSRLGEREPRLARSRAQPMPKHWRAPRTPPDEGSQPPNGIVVEVVAT
jgi:hypothetical protein